MTERDLSRFDNSDFNRGASRLKEVGWYCVRAVFFGSLFPLPSSLLCFWLRFFGAKIGKNVVLRRGLNVSFPWRLRIGDNVWLGEEVSILSLAEVCIESNVCVSQRAFLCTGSHDYYDSTFSLITKPIRLESGSWVAAMAFIGPGVVVGKGSVCAAGSVVTKSVAPYHLVSGNPAVTIRDISSKNPAKTL